MAIVEFISLLIGGAIFDKRLGLVSLHNLGLLSLKLVLALGN
jgi:hypothetical protein